jgi:hypothetical protein
VTVAPRPRVRPSVVACGVLLLTLIAIGGSLPTEMAHATASPPVVSLEVESAPRSMEVERPATASAGATLVLNTLAEPNRAALALALRDLADALARRTNPLFVSVDDVAEKSATELLRALAPRFTAAAALSARRWRSSSGDLAVHASERCAGKSTCYPITARPATADLEKRVRFVAWPIGYAIILDTGRRADAQRIATALQAMSPDVGVALALTAADLHRLRRSPALDRVFRQARRVRDHLAGGAALLDSLEALLAAASSPDEVPWLRLPPGGVLVVPRLSALATSRRFVAGVSDRLGALQIEPTWLAAPP